MKNNDREDLKKNLHNIFKKVRRLNLYVNELNDSVKLNDSRVEEELNQIKNCLKNAEDAYFKNGIQQKFLF